MSDSNAAHICIKDLLDMGFSFSQASLFVKYIAGNDDEVACEAAAARVRDLMLFFFSHTLRLLQQLLNKVQVIQILMKILKNAWIVLKDIHEINLTKIYF